MKTIVATEMGYDELQDLVNRGVIPEGNIIIEVCW